MRCFLTVIIALASVVLVAGCKDDTGEASLPKPLTEAEIQKLGPKEQENVRRFQEMQRQNSGGQIR